MDKLLKPEVALSRLAHEDEMVGYLPTAPSISIPRAASIDTPLHAYVPDPHVDHMHPDSVIAIAAPRNSARPDAEDLRRRNRLAAVAAARVRAGPEAAGFWRRHPTRRGGVILEAHGLFTWGDDFHECYETTLGSSKGVAWFGSAETERQRARRRAGTPCAPLPAGARSRDS